MRAAPVRHQRLIPPMQDLPLYPHDPSRPPCVRERAPDAWQQSWARNAVEDLTRLWRQRQVSVWPYIRIELGHDHPRRHTRVQPAQPLFIWAELDRDLIRRRTLGRDRQNDDVAWSD